MKMKTRIASIILGTAVLASPLTTVINQDAGVVYAWQDTLPKGDNIRVIAGDFGFMPEESTIEDGDVDVPADAVFMLKFNRYVTHESILENNRMNIRVYEMVDGKHKLAKATIDKLPKEYEDKIEDKDDYRNFLSINFEEYNPSTIYKLVVGDELMSSDEDGQLLAELGKGFEISFTSASEVEAPPVKPEEPPVEPEKPSVETPIEEIVVDSKAKYLNGFEDGTIRPDAKITRVEVAKILTDVIKSAPDVEGVPVITDLDQDEWYIEYTNFVIDKGLMIGNNSGNFRPNAEITRAEVVTTIRNLIKSNPGGANPFKDLKKNHWAYDNIMSAFNGEYVVGNEGNFNPDASITRSEVAQIINNVIGKEVDLDVYEDQIKTYPDLKENHWGYKAMIKGTIKVK